MRIWKCIGIGYLYQAVGIIIMMLPALVVAQENMQVRATAAPPTISRGQKSEITILAFSIDRGPLQDAHISIWAGDGVFSNGTSIVFGRTDNEGLFRTHWTCYEGQCGRGSKFNLLVKIEKKGFNKAEKKVKISIK
jgi:hypothetical protein